MSGDCVETVLVVGGCLVTVWELSWWWGMSGDCVGTVLVVGGCLVTVGTVLVGGMSGDCGNCPGGGMSGDCVGTVLVVGGMSGDCVGTVLVGGCLVTV